MKNFRKNFALMCLMLMFLFSLVGYGAVYEGTADGYKDKISVKVELKENGEILGVKVDKNDETEGIGDLAIEKVSELIQKKKSLDVDSLAGATITSEAVIKAVANALKSGGIDPKRYNYVERIEEVEEKKIVKIDLNKMPKKKAIEKTVLIKDAKGREVKIGLPISSYAISTMDVIDYIVPLKGKEAFEMLVGSGEDGGHGFGKYAKVYEPVVGNYLEHTAQISEHNSPFDLEAILSVQPDVLIVNSAMAAHRYALEIEELLDQAGIKIVLIDVPGKKLEKSVQQTMKILGQVFGEEKRAKEVSNFIDKQYNLIESKKLDKHPKKPTVYYEKSGYSQIFGPTSTSKRGWGTVINLSGAINIADELLVDSVAKKGAGNRLDPEYVLKANPDFIILSGINDGWLSSVSKKKKCKFDIINRNGWNGLNAVKNRKVFEFAHSTSRSIFSFYPTLKLATILYPEEFKGVNPEAILNEFFDRFMLVDSTISTWYYDLDDVK